MSVGEEVEAGSNFLRPPLLWRKFRADSAHIVLGRSNTRKQHMIHLAPDPSTTSNCSFFFSI